MKYYNSVPEKEKTSLDVLRQRSDEQQNTVFVNTVSGLYRSTYGFREGFDRRFDPEKTSA